MTTAIIVTGLILVVGYLSFIAVDDKSYLKGLFRIRTYVKNTPVYRVNVTLALLEGGYLDVGTIYCLRGHQWTVSRAAERLADYYAKYGYFKNGMNIPADQICFGGLCRPSKTEETRATFALRIVWLGFVPIGCAFLPLREPDETWSDGTN